jgi:hypothetical protein
MHFHPKTKNLKVALKNVRKFDGSVPQMQSHLSHINMEISTLYILPPKGFIHTPSISKQY